MDKIYVRNIKDTIDIIENNLKVQLTGKEMYIPTWIGKPGIGKTAHAKMIAKDLNLKFYYVSMSKPVEFFSGLPLTNSITLEDIKKKNTYAYWTKSDLIYHANKYSKLEKYDGVLLFLDDLHIANPSVQSMFFELVLERSLGGFKLNKNVAMMAAMNDSTDAGFEGFYSAIMNRLQLIHVKMDFNYWYESMGMNINPYIATFLKNNPDFREEPENTKEPFATYRSWTILSDLLNQMDDRSENFPDEVFYAAIGFVGTPIAISLKESVAIQQQFDFEGILNGKKEHNLDPKDYVRQIIFSNIVRYIKKPEHGDFLEKTLDKLADDSNGDSYKNAITGILLEMKSYRFYLNKKIHVYENDDEKKKIVKKYQEIYDILLNISKHVISKPIIKKIGVLSVI